MKYGMTKKVICLLFLLQLLAAGCSNPSGNYGGVYVIDNAAFGISANKTNARATTDGFNRAIEKAREGGYTTVKFAPGEYLVACVSDVMTYPTDGIFLYSNMSFDLGDAVFYAERNDSHSYGVFQLERLENVTITGGTILGDKDGHIYPADESRIGQHIYGSAFHIISCENVLIRDVKMSAFTGAAIRIYTNTEMRMYQMFPTDTIRITGCEFDDGGIKGIEIFHARNVEIDNNRFTDFSNRVGKTSLWEVCGIRTVRWKDAEDRYDTLTKDIKIHHNYFENCGGAVVMLNGEDCEISDNYSEGGMIGIMAGHRMKIHRNTIAGGYIQFSEGEVYHNEDICVPTEGPDKNDCTLVNAGIIQQTGAFPCD
jgi:polygalacturonase